MDFIFALNHSIILCRLEFVSRRKAYSREQRKFHDVGGLGRILLVLCGCPSEANVWKPPVFVGRLLPLARGSREGMNIRRQPNGRKPKEHTTVIAEAVYFGVPSRVSPSLYIYGTLTLPATTRAKAVHDSDTYDTLRYPIRASPYVA